MNKILIVDDEKNMRWAMKKALKTEDYQVFEAANGQEGVEKFQELQPDLVLLDLKMPVMDGLEALQKMKGIDEHIPVIMITAHGTTESAVEAMKLGAIDYISKPFDIEELKIVIHKALQVKGLQDKVDYLKEELQSQTGKTIIGKSEKMEAILNIVDRVAQTNATILILGESGTGKEVIANAIHYNSGRREGPYIKVNCGAIPENLIESELFGYEKGAFTGATNRKIGKFERAKNGTIFLDEIGDLNLNMQVKLLRVLQEKEFERVGGNENIQADVRVIAATNRDLYKMVEEERFREDLFYRLNVIPIELPALRERQEDIPLLIEYFIDKYSSEIGRKNMTIDDEAKEKLISYQWRGNIRELENVIERMLILSAGNVISKENLPPEILREKIPTKDFALPDEGLSIDDLEKDLIKQALERTNHNQTKAAQLLGMSRHTLLYRIEKYNLKK
ncbi:two component, sigma54 specific, transcriptional regulator, Fis family [Alkaliphilus metalliredigens QYMF]|uniref:Stage 0 sporulation protein A homolog n=1 Tax=Alkaliphilus metalliredigens (strain QYMF) TaxID=293826 RepID=A6TT75_ALKMQ|nr:sigma-54 dependent transcriptional regulator [Alkaliphilus metalliredigens]ABR49393.1 two component, sigma54 specific, transcriptional regulator, Fis family [Alkaliphilus metalliredigens QYMF]